MTIRILISWPNSRHAHRTRGSIAYLLMPKGLVIQSVTTASSNVIYKESHPHRLFDKQAWRPRFPRVRFHVWSATFTKLTRDDFTVTLGKSGLKVSKIILGCMTYGKTSWQPWFLDEKEGIEHIKTAWVNYPESSRLFFNETMQLRGRHKHLRYRGYLFERC